MCGIIDHHYALSCPTPSCHNPTAWSKTYRTSKTCYRDPNDPQQGFKTFAHRDCLAFSKVLKTEYLNIGSATYKACILKWMEGNYRKEGFLRDRGNWFLKPVPYYLSSVKERQRYELMRERQEFVVGEFQRRRAEVKAEEAAGSVKGSHEGEDDGWSVAETLADEVDPGGS